jgi:hypothetical protein
VNAVIYRSRVLLTVFIAMVVIQLADIYPGLMYISGAFPTHFHRIEAIILTFVLLISLIVTSFFYGRLQYIALIIIGALMFHSAYKVVLEINSVEPIHVRITWARVSFIMSVSLAWVIFGARRLGVFSWGGLAISFMIASAGVLWLIWGWQLFPQYVK